MFGDQMKNRSRMDEILAAWTSIAICLIILLTAGVQGCSKFKKGEDKGPYQSTFEWIDQTRDRINKSISDPKKATTMLTLVDDIEKLMYEFNDDVQRYYKNVRAVNADYDATREDFERVAEEFNAKRIRTRSEVMKIRFQMTELATPEEWKDLSDQKKTLYANWQKGSLSN
jgi:hypothetical protein